MIKTEVLAGLILGFFIGVVAVLILSLIKNIIKSIKNSRRDIEKERKENAEYRKKIGYIMAEEYRDRKMERIRVEESCSNHYIDSYIDKIVSCFIHHFKEDNLNNRYILITFLESTKEARQFKKYENQFTSDDESVEFINRYFDRILINKYGLNGYVMKSIFKSYAVFIALPINEMNIHDYLDGRERKSEKSDHYIFMPKASDEIHTISYEDYLIQESLT